MMRINILKVFAAAFLLLGIINTSSAENLTPIGYWQTIDDKTAQVLSVVQIYAEKNGTLSGKIVEIMPVLGQKPTDLCTACKDKLKDQPILGMQIMWNMRQDGNGSSAWVDGKVLDPKSGNVYSGKMTLMEHAQQLKLRGYILMPLLGRSEIWQRLPRRSDNEGGNG